MAVIRIGEHQAKALEMLKEKGPWSPDKDWNHLGAWRMQRLLESLIPKEMVFQQDGQFVVKTPAPEYTTMNTGTSRARRRQARTTRIVTENHTTTKSRKLSPSQLAAALPTNLLVQEVERRGWKVERLSAFDQIVDWDI